MSKITEIEKTSSKLHNDIDISKIFIFDNKFEKSTFKNITGVLLALKAGMLLGRVAVGGKLLVMKSNAVDGSEIPVGVLAQDIDIADTAEADVIYCVGGEVAEQKLIFNKVGDDLDTVVDARNYRDRIKGDTAGIILRATDELTDFDNQ